MTRSTTPPARRGKPPATRRAAEAVRRLPSPAPSSGAHTAALREARGEAGLLACLLAIVALLACTASAAPPLLDRLAGQALESRVEQAQQTRALVRQSIDLQYPGTPVDPSTSTLAADLAAASAQTVKGAGAPLAGVLHPQSVRIEYSSATTTTSAGRVLLEPLYADDAPAPSLYTRGRPPRAPSNPQAPVDIAVSTATRDALHLTLGQTLDLEPAVDLYTGVVRVVGFFTEPASGAGPLWRQEPLLARPASIEGVWRAEAVTAAAGMNAFQNTGAHTPMTVTFSLGLHLTGATATRLATPGGLAALRSAAADYAQASSGSLCPPDDDLDIDGCTIGRYGVADPAVDDGIPPLLQQFAQARQQARTLESFALAGLLAVGLATIVVAARLSLRRRAAVQALQRARGASATDLAYVRLLQTGPVAAAGLLAGLVAARLVVPRGLPLGSPLPAVGVALIAWLTLPALTWAALRERGRRTERPPGPARRVTVEAAVLLLAAAGVFALRSRGSGGGSAGLVGIDPQVAAAPVLLGLASVVLLVRIYPLPLRVLARAARHRRGTVGLIAMSRAARGAPTQALALLVLVITLSTAVFGGLVSRTVTDGRRATAVWAAGADATVVGAGRDGTPDPALASSPGVRRAVVVRGTTTRITSRHDGLSFPRTRVAGVDAGALRAAAPGSAAARLLLGTPGMRTPPKSAGGDLVLPALASADFGTGAVGATYTSSLHNGHILFRVTGLLTSPVLHDPALGPLLDTDAAVDAGPGGDPSTAAARPMLLVDSSELRTVTAHDTDFSAVLLYGPHLDVGRLRVTAERVTGPSGDLRIRSEELAAAEHDGLLRSVRQVYAVSTACAVLLALLALVLELLLTSRDRGRTASRLRTLGLPTRGIAALNVLELVPMALAAAAGGLALGLVLPAVLGPALTLRRFTGGPAAPPTHTDHALTTALGLGVVVLVAVAVAVETWLGRRRGLGAVLRLGDAA